MGTMNIKANIAHPTPITHEGAIAYRIGSEQELRRSLMACMLWEDTFYESGESIADRIAFLIPIVDPSRVSAMAIEAREKMKLRHVPLWVVCNMAALQTHKHLVSDTLFRIIQRPDELTEFLSIYQKERIGTKRLNKLSKQAQKGLALAFSKFDEYQLAKYNRDTEVKLRDVLFLCHAKPKNEEQASLWKRLISGELKTPDTWEVELSASKEKKSSWERLLNEGKLGALALLRNLRNMNDAGVNEQLVFHAIEIMKTERILPFRFIAAARYAPQWEPQIEKAMIKCLETHERLSGKTAVVIDGSGSMFEEKISKKSELDRFDAACALAILVREICENVQIVVFSNNAYIVPARHGFALRDAIHDLAEHGGTYTQQGLVKAAEFGYDRIIVITDEQSHETVRNPISGTRGYFINVASYQNGIGYGKEWLHIDGFSESIINYIMEYERADGVR